MGVTVDLDARGIVLVIDQQSNVNYAEYRTGLKFASSNN